MPAEFEGVVKGSNTPMPDQFGKYSLLGHLATGGMAEVYLARQAGIQGFEKIVVIKRIRPELTDEMTTSMFVDEARLVATLEHPNIAQVYEIGRVQDSYFFVMEYVHGADLRGLLEASLKKKRKLSLADAVYIISHVCAALHYAHEKCDHDGNHLNLIHRDVSPSNVLLSHDGAVKVCDFGIAKATGRSAETERGVLKGKFAYMSPEQCRSETLDRRSDIFSIGILLYETTTVSRLFKAPSDFDLLRMIVEANVDPPSKRVADYPPELERIVMKALSKDPANRYATAQEMQEDLEAFAREQRLAMSSINIAKAMGDLFEKRLHAWKNAQREGRRLEDHLMDTAVRRDSGDLPLFMPIGSNQDDPDIEVEPDTQPAVEATPHRLMSMKMPAQRRTAPIAVQAGPELDEAPVRSRPSALWLVGMLLAGAIGAGAGVAGRMVSDSATKDISAAVQGDAEKIASALDTASRSAHMRADSISTTPMLRAAITTDSATMKDLAEHEYVFPLGKRETLEVFQLNKGAMKSMIRLPADARPIDQLAPQETRLRINGTELEVVAGAPIASTSSSVAGVLAMTSPVDLGLARHTLADHVGRAELVGLAAPLVLVDGPAAGDAVKVTLPATGDIGVTLELVVHAKPAKVAKVNWVTPVRYSGFGLAALFLLVYVSGLRRRS